MPATPVSIDPIATALGNSSGQWATALGNRPDGPMRGILVAPAQGEDARIMQSTQREVGDVHRVHWRVVIDPTDVEEVARPIHWSVLIHGGPGQAERGVLRGHRHPIVEPNHDVEPSRRVRAEAQQYAQVAVHARGRMVAGVITRHLCGAYLSDPLRPRMQ